MPKLESTQEGVAIASQARLLRKRSELVGVAAPEDHIFGFERGDQASDDVVDITFPSLLTRTLTGSRS